jgi:tRNA (guanine37-N1)-methyltransferase
VCSSDLSLDQVIFVCPRYEGHDERIRKFVDEEISIGDFILTGGELAAAVIIDSITRLIPGVLGKPESLRNESHSTPGYLEYPQYTRPETFEFKKTMKKNKIKKIPSPRFPRIPRHPLSLPNNKIIIKLRVPKILLSGHHANVAEWRKEHEKRKG